MKDQEKQEKLFVIFDSKDYIGYEPKVNLDDYIKGVINE